MDAQHFGLRQRPFPTTPDSSFYYPATSHEHALGRLLQGLEDGEGVLALNGLPGTGKTLLCHCLLERLGEDRPSLLLTNSHLRDRASLLQALLFDLSLPYEGKSEQEMRLALTAQLLETFRQGQSTVVVIDEAHHLSADLLEELRLLGNLEARAGKAVQVVLVGQPSLLDTLRQPELAALWQRLTVRVELQPLDVQEAADYLLHHLRVAGGQAEEIFTAEALELLAMASQGVPRLLNQTAHQALAVATEAELAEVDAEVVLEALSVLEIEAPEAASELDAPVVPEMTLPEIAPEEGPKKPERQEFTQEELSGQRFFAPRNGRPDPRQGKG
jgi:type II secretory pathway predicted ATPase ExeA